MVDRRLTKNAGSSAQPSDELFDPLRSLMLVLVGALVVFGAAVGVALWSI